MKEQRDQYFGSAPSHFQWFQEENKFLESTVAGNETTPFHSANKTSWNQVETPNLLQQPKNAACQSAGKVLTSIF